MSQSLILGTLLDYSLQSPQYFGALPGSFLPTQELFVLDLPLPPHSTPRLLLPVSGVKQVSNAPRPRDTADALNILIEEGSLGSREKKHGRFAKPHEPSGGRDGSKLWPSD